MSVKHLHPFEVWPLNFDLAFQQFCKLEKLTQTHRHDTKHVYRYSYKQTLIRPVAMCAYFTEIVITLAQLSGGKSVSAFTHVCPGILSKRSTVGTIFFLTLCINGIGRK